MADHGVKIQGVIPALVLCNDDKGRISRSHMERQLGYLLESGIHGVYLNGTTGEGAVLSSEEKGEIVRMARSIIGDRIPIYAVCLQPSTDAVIREAKAMADCGAACVAAVTPYYYPASQQALVGHFTRIAEESPLPLMLYNIPQNTHCPIAPETVIALAAHRNIVGIKDSSGNFAGFHRMLLSTDPAWFSCVQGDDMLDAASFLIGAPAVVTGLGNVRVEHYVEMFNAAQAGDRERMFELQRRTYAVAGIIAAAGGRTIPAIKAAVEILGRGSRAMRIESLSLGDAEVAEVQRALEAAGAV